MSHKFGVDTVETITCWLFYRFHLRIRVRIWPLQSISYLSQLDKANATFGSLKSRSHFTFKPKLAFISVYNNCFIQTIIAVVQNTIYTVKSIFGTIQPLLCWFTVKQAQNKQNKRHFVFHSPVSQQNAQATPIRHRKWRHFLSAMDGKLHHPTYSPDVSYCDNDHFPILKG